MINEAVIWIRMVSFTSLFVAVVLALLSYQQRPFRWLGNYILFLSAHALFDLVYTYALIRRLYLSVEYSGSVLVGNGLVYLVLDTVATIVVLYFAPRFVLHTVATPSRGATRALIVPAFVVAVASVLSVIVAESDQVSRGVAAVLYAYLAGWFGFGFLRRRAIPEGIWRRWVVLFLGGAAIWHGMTAVEAILLPVWVPTTPPVPAAAVTSSVFNLFWAAVVAIPVTLQFRAPAAGIAADAAELPAAFVREFELTPREAEIVLEICRGAGTKEVGAKLFISPRTVDTHIQNIYRKCDIRRRVELVTLVGRYSQER
jgi:DNA-binding CsgD family transcriptional regulator